MINRLCDLQKSFQGTKFQLLIETAISQFKRGEIASCEKTLDKLPTEQVLLSALLDKLKGKSAYKTLKRISEGKVSNNCEEMKGLSSLITHALIECEQGNLEFRLIIFETYKKLSKLFYSNLFIGGASL